MTASLSSPTPLKQHIPSKKPVKTYHSIPKNSVPIVDIIDRFDQSPEKVHFCYQILEKTLTSLVNLEYSKFDAHTATSCCHGMSILVRELIQLSQEENLNQLLSEVRQRIENSNEDSSWHLPKSLTKLCQLFILNYALNMSSKGARMNSQKLLNIAPISRKFCDKLIRKLKMHYANLVALRYEKYLSEVSGKIKTCDVHVDLWGKYASHEHLRTCKDGLHYASSLFSMQVILGYLIFSKAKIAIVNDIVDETGKFTRYLRILRGDGISSFSLLDGAKDINDEPIVVFSGCAKTKSADHIVKRMDEWTHRFPNLVLAHETTYPQFPRVNDEFPSHPIHPEEELLQNLISEHKKTTGLSAKDPTLYYLNHIYTSSIGQILQERLNPESMPLSFQLLSAVSAE